MDWSNSKINSYTRGPGSLFFGHLNFVDGIDLRMEMHNILYGTFGAVNKGHWVVLRNYDRTKPSAVYDKRAHEGVGGSAFQYTDIMVRTRQVPISKAVIDRLPVKTGYDIENTYIYYFEWTVTPKFGDDIIELDLPTNTVVKPTLGVPELTVKYTIDKVHPYRLEGGDIQYWMALAKYNEVTR